MALDSTDPEVLEHAGKLLERSGRYTDAAKAYSRAAAITGDPSVMMRAAYAAERGGDRAMADAFRQQASAAGNVASERAFKEAQDSRTTEGLSQLATTADVVSDPLGAIFGEGIDALASGLPAWFVVGDQEADLKGATPREVGYSPGFPPENRPIADKDRLPDYRKPLPSTEPDTRVDRLPSSGDTQSDLLQPGPSDTRDMSGSAPGRRDPGMGFETPAEARSRYGIPEFGMGNQPMPTDRPLQQVGSVPDETWLTRQEAARLQGAGPGIDRSELGAATEIIDNRPSESGRSIPRGELGSPVEVVDRRPGRTPSPMGQSVRRSGAEILDEVNIDRAFREALGQAPKAAGAAAAGATAAELGAATLGAAGPAMFAYDRYQSATDPGYGIKQLARLKGRPLEVSDIDEDTQRLLAREPALANRLMREGAISGDAAVTAFSPVAAGTSNDATAEEQMLLAEIRRSQEKANQEAAVESERDRLKKI